MVNKKVTLVTFIPMNSRPAQISYKFKDRSPEYAAGFLSSATNIILTYPITKLIFRQQIFRFKTIHAYQQLKNEGFTILYRGMSLPLLQKTLSLSIMFGTNSHYLHIFQSFSKNNHWYYQPIAAALAGSTEAILTPLERIQVLLQTPKYNQIIRNSFHAFSLIYRHYGMIEYYRGLTFILVRNSVSNVIFFSCRKPIKNILPCASSIFQDSIYDFISGGLLGALLSTFIYPLNVLKNIQQSELGGRHDRSLNMFRLFYKQRGSSMKEFYIGARWNFIRSLISWGIINSTYEFYLVKIRKAILDE